MATSIQISSLSRRFPGTDYPAVDDLSLEVAGGTFFTLLGPSGCGKTTTLRCIAGLEHPDSGEIRIGDTVVFSSRSRVNVPPHRRRIGMVFQSYAIWPHMTVHQNVAYPLKNLGLNRAEIDKAVAASLQLVGLSHLAKRPAPLLSGGEQQRVALARALVEEPAVLLLDEPLSNLDAKLREQMRFELRDLQQKLGLTTIYVTHDQDEAFSLSDVMAVMHRGKVVELGGPDEVYQVPRTTFGAEFLGAATRIPGRVLRLEGDDLLVVNSSIGDLTCRCKAPVTAGSEVLVYVRPEDLRVMVEDSAPSGRVIDARVTRTTFLGGTTEWWAEANGVGLRGRSLSNTRESRVMRDSERKSVSLSISVTRCVASDGAS